MNPHIHVKITLPTVHVHVLLNHIHCNNIAGNICLDQNVARQKICKNNPQNEFFLIKFEYIFANAQKIKSSKNYFAQQKCPPILELLVH